MTESNSASRSPSIIEGRNSSRFSKQKPWRNAVCWLACRFLLSHLSHLLDPPVHGKVPPTVGWPFCINYQLRASSVGMSLRQSDHSTPFSEDSKLCQLDTIAHMRTPRYDTAVAEVSLAIQWDPASALQSLTQSIKSQPEGSQSPAQTYKSRHSNKTRLTSVKFLHGIL